MQDKVSVEKSRAIRCSVISGRGLAALSRREDVSELASRTSCALLPGSLNLIARIPIYLDPKSAILVRGNHMYFAAKLNTTSIILDRWRGAPAHIFEVFSEIHLRNALSLKDGEVVTLAIPDSAIDQYRTTSFRHRLTWFVMWRFRERLFYDSDEYANYVRTRWRVRYSWRANQ